LLWGSLPLNHDDVFFHLYAGETIAHSKAIAPNDTFSHSRHGVQWVSHEWGFGLVVYHAWALGGLAGMVVLQAVLGCAVVVSMTTLLRRGTSRDEVPLIPALLGLMLWAAYNNLALRAALLGALFLTWELLLLRAYRDTGSVRWLFGLPLLFFVWSNAHAGVVFGLLVLGAVTIEAHACAWSRTITPSLARAGRPMRYLALLCIALAIAIANPNGFAGLLYPIEVSRFLLAHLHDMEMGIFATATPSNSPGFYVLLVVLLAGLVPFRRSTTPSIAEIMLLALFWSLAIRSHRFIVEFSIIALPVAYRLHAAHLSRALGLGLSVLVAFVLVSTIHKELGDRTPRLLREDFPVRAAEFLERERIRGRMWNPQNYGGYLGWRLRQPVFWDGRAMEFASLTEEFGHVSFSHTVNRYRLDYVILREAEWRALAKHLEPAHWGLVYWDDYWAIFVRRIPRFDAVLERHELNILPPFGRVPEIVELARDPERARRVRTELDRLLEMNPENQRAAYFLAAISYHAGDLRRARSELLRALTIRPNVDVERALDKLRIELVLDAQSGDD
jgi:hypothetical protein